MPQLVVCHIATRLRRQHDDYCLRHALCAKRYRVRQQSYEVCTRSKVCNVHFQRAWKRYEIYAARTISLHMFLADLTDTAALYHPPDTAANENGSSHSGPRARCRRGGIYSNPRKKEACVKNHEKWPTKHSSIVDFTLSPAQSPKPDRGNELRS